MPTRPAANGDRSNGYEAVAAEFARRRDASNIGVATVVRWARALPPGSTLLDLGCGHGLPLAKALIDAGFKVHGIDASPTLVASFRERLPDTPVTCCAVEDSDFFDRHFDGVLAIGLVFLLRPDVQRELICRVSRALVPGGRFLFTVPQVACEWTDVLTGCRSTSLGAAAYEKLLASTDLARVDAYVDEGDNYYIDAQRPT